MGIICLGLGGVGAPVTTIGDGVMSYEDCQLLSLVEEIYESSLDPVRWTDVLDKLSGFVGAIGADLYISRADVPPFVSFTGISDDLMHDYLTHFHDQNERVKAIARKPEGATVTDYDVVTRAEMARSPYYQEFLSKNGYGLFIGCSSLNRRDESALFGIHYARGVDAYRKEHFRRLQLVMPHVRRAAQLQNGLKTSIAKEARMAAVIDTISSGLVLLDRNRKIVHLNLAAERLLTKKTGAFITNQRVRLVQPDLDRRLQRITFDAIRRHVDTRDGGSALLVRSEHSSYPLSIVVFPLPLRVCLEDSVGAILVITEPFARVPTIALDIIMAVFGLTAAEARLAMALANGETVKSYARRIGRSVETVRDQLKTTMAKTGANRQAGLVRLVLNTIGSLSNPHL